MPNGHAFDPCREWLGIAAVDLADPRKVLDLLSGDITPLAVVHAADARLARLRSIDAGPFELARTSLITRVEEARDALLAAASQPPRPAGGAFAPPPPPGAGRVPLAPGRPGFPVGAGDDGTGDELVIRTGPRRVRSSRGGGTLPAIFSLVCLAAAAIALAVFWPRVQEILGPKPTPRRGDGEKLGTSESPPPAAPVADEPSLPGSTSPPPTPQDGSATPPPLMKPEPSTTDLPTRQPVEPDTPTPRVAKPAPAKPKPAASEPATADEPSGDPPVEGEAEPSPPERRPARMKSSADDNSATGILRRVLAALQEDDFDAAEQAVASAEAAAETDEVFDRVSVWRQFTGLARQAAGYRDQALEATADGGEYEIDGRTISVVEVSDEKFVYKAAGQMNRLRRDQIPPAILLAILRRWFEADGRGANHIFLGVHLLTRAKPDVEGARREWETARRRGEDTTLLERLLDDPVFLETGRR